MNSANDINTELIEMGSELANMSRAMPFAVPNLYFNSVLSNLNNSIANAPETALTIPHINMPDFVVPDGYFEAVTTQIITAATIEAIDIAATNKIIPYKVPNNYFETLPKAILDKAADKAPNSIITTNNKLTISSNNWRHYLKWSIAAALVIGIGYTSYHKFYAPIAAPTENILASTEDSEINEYLSHVYKEDAENIVSNATITALPINNNEIVAYLDETGWD